MIKTILFDLGNVIIPFDFRLPMRSCSPFAITRSPRSLSACARPDLVSRFESGHIGAQQFVREFSAELELSIDYDDFCDLWTSVFLPEPLIQESLLTDLGARYRLMILSNTNPIHFHMIQDELSTAAAISTIACSPTKWAL